MKGLVFTEFLDMVEQQFSAEMVDNIIEATDLASKGAYTAVGTYPHYEFIALVQTLAQQTHCPAPQLIKHFGHYLFQRFATLYPIFFAEHQTAFDFLGSIENHVHTEVHKLYPEAELPTFDIECSADKQYLLMVYRSKHPFATLAEGLIEGCLQYFNEQASIDIIHQIPMDGYCVEFHLRKVNA